MKVEQLTFNIPAGRRRFLYRFFTPAFCLACIALLFFSPVSSDAARDVPGYKGYVNDYASMISPEVRTNLEKNLHSFDLSDSTQVAILTIDSLEGDPIEDFSIRVVDQWKIGQQGKDNGVLFLVAKNDRKMRIEVGRGLEHVLTDLAAGRIIDRVVAPLFKEGRFDEGFEAGTTAIIQTTRGEYTHPPENSGSGKSPQFVNYLFFGGVLLYFLSSNSRALGAMGGAVLLPLLFYLGLPGLLNWPILMILVPVGALIGLMFSFLLSAIPKHSGRSSRGGFYTGGFGGYSGGSFGGGGFGGFGGGSFGGGGASGGW